MSKTVSRHEVARHDNISDVWIIVNENVYDITEFAPQHPGGPEMNKVIYQFAGRDASDEYNRIHAPSLIKKALEDKNVIGSVDASSASAPSEKLSSNSPVDELDQTNNKPPLSTIINLHDFETVAALTLSKKAWAYIDGASNDNLTRDANLAFLRRTWLRPAVLRNVGTVNTKSRLFGCSLDFPVYISPTGAAMTAGREGELALAKGASETGIIQCISTPTSFPHEEILEDTSQHAFFQLYVNKDRGKSEDLLRRVTASGKVKAIFVTADLPVVSKREADERVKVDDVAAETKNQAAIKTKDWKGSGLARQTGSFIDPTLNWDDISWLRQLTDLPIVLKGIQRWEDAKLAMQRGFQGIVLSNHGGRAADGATPTIVLLLELHRNCPEIFQSMEILIDGGFRRGSDVVKAICLGASAVGLGRPFLYAVNYGQDGVKHAVNILRDEIETAMRLCGIADLMKDAHPDFINTSDIDHYVVKGGHPYALKVQNRTCRL
ncbi:hypothetical protein AK830_g8559 [Neonectria ditissima]|uniref:L-lactate dehydrogenase (cytochrome) n=1 Tax=Neonectria ditissima TaxID=78410 RepID=A0A0P7AX53_9HYPO|nr:hypothetical protein AK830_g8559 [Neonectria ditissima]